MVPARSHRRSAVLRGGVSLVSFYFSLLCLPAKAMGEQCEAYIWPGIAPPKLNELGPSAKRNGRVSSSTHVGGVCCAQKMVYVVIDLSYVPQTFVSAKGRGDGRSRLSWRLR